MFKEPQNFEKQSKGGGMSKKTTIVKKNEEDKKPTCSHYKKEGHVKDHCWKLHPKLKPKSSYNKKDKNKYVVIVHDLGSDSEDEVKVTNMGIKGKMILDLVLQPTVECEANSSVDVVPVKKGKYIVDSFSFVVVCSVLLFSLLLISGVWLVVATMNGSICEYEGMVNLINNYIPVFIITVMNKMLIIPVGKMDGIGQVR